LLTENASDLAVFGSRFVTSPPLGAVTATDAGGASTLTFTHPLSMTAGDAPFIEASKTTRPVVPDAAVWYETRTFALAPEPNVTVD
jgi:hypothetical protein